MTNIISTAGTLLISFYVCGRAINHKDLNIKKIALILWCLVWAVMFSIEPIPLLMIRVIFCTASVVFIWKLHKIKIDTALPAFLLAYGISYVFYAFAHFIASIVFNPFLSDRLMNYSVVNFNEPIFLLFYAIIAILQFLFAYFFYKIRRFKLGFPFLSERLALVVTLIIAGIILAVSSFLTSQRGNIGTFYMIFIFIIGVAVIGTGIYIWIRMNFNFFQRKKMWERNEELHLQEKEELTCQIQHYKEMHEAVRDANHRMLHRQTVTERSILRLLKKAQEYGLPAEFNEELTMELVKVQELSREYQERVGVKVNKKLPSSNIHAIDGMFALFADRFEENDMDFNLKVNGSIVYMVEKIVNQSKLETMIGDHLQDALIAVNAGTGGMRSILAMIGEFEGCYEFSVHDSGIPFEVETLMRLGLEYVTTHAENGGSGVGFMTTFETMRECGASLIIKENVPGSGFSKSVTIRFDGEKKYIIKTHRPDDFPLNDRYIIVGY